MQNIPVHAVNSIFLDQDICTNPGAGNNTYQFTFQQSVRTSDSSRITVTNFSVPFSWFNITAAYGNNTFNLVWYDGAGTTTYAITIPDGFYSLSVLNSYLQWWCLQHGLYLVNPSGQNVFYVEFVTNKTIYRDQINCYQLPTTVGAPVGWSLGTLSLIHI